MWGESTCIWTTDASGQKGKSEFAEINSPAQNRDIIKHHRDMAGMAKVSGLPPLKAPREEESDMGRPLRVAGSPTSVAQSPPRSPVSPRGPVYMR